MNLNIQKEGDEQDYYDEEKMTITFTEVPRDFRFRYKLLSSDFKGWELVV